MTNREIARRRMSNQHVWGAPLKSPENVVRWLAALQAQEYPLAKWSVAQRAKDVGDTDMGRAFAEGAILRTHLLRPTWHFVLPDDIRWLLELTAPRVHALNASMYRKLELDDRVFAKTNSLLGESLEGGRHLTRTEIAESLERAGISASGLRLGYILMRAELDAVVCSGAPRGKQQTYAAFDERVPPPTKPVDRDEALAELMRRYFTSRGPATLKDFLRWSSLTTSEGKAGLEIVGPQLEREVIDGRTYWSAGSRRGRSPVAPRIDLVQGYDECIMSYGESKDVLFVSMESSESPERTVFTHAILLNGQLIGHWKPVRAKDSVTVVSAPYRPLSQEESGALDAAVDRFGRFVGVPTTAA